MIFCGYGLVRVIATKARRLEETRRFLPGRKELRRLRGDDFFVVRVATKALRL